MENLEAHTILLKFVSPVPSQAHTEEPMAAALKS